MKTCILKSTLKGLFFLNIVIKSQQEQEYFYISLSAKTNLADVLIKTNTLQ